MIYCADLRCKYRNDKGKCTCKKVMLSAWDVNTIYMGKKDFLECKSFEYDEEYIEMWKKLLELGVSEKLPNDLVEKVKE